VYGILFGIVTRVSLAIFTLIVVPTYDVKLTGPPPPDYVQTPKPPGFDRAATVEVVVGRPAEGTAPENALDVVRLEIPRSSDFGAISRNFVDTYRQHVLRPCLALVNEQIMAGGLDVEPVSSIRGIRDLIVQHLGRDEESTRLPDHLDVWCTQIDHWIEIPSATFMVGNLHFGALRTTVPDFVCTEDYRRHIVQWETNGTRITVRNVLEQEIEWDSADLARVAHGTQPAPDPWECR
jgi:hypothetical protein